MEVQSLAELFNLSGKSAIVTGGGLGIGQAICFRLAEAGASVTVTDIDMDAASKTVEEIRSKGGSAQAIQADASSAEDAAKAMRSAKEAYGSIDILVNNAGIYPLKPFMKVSEELWNKVMDINLKGPFLYCQAAASEMIEAGKGGKIVNIASIDALHPTGNTSHYNASKGGVLMFTKAVALELAPHGILVNAIAPGNIMTPGTIDIRKRSGRYSDAEPAERTGNFNERLPLGRPGYPDDIARTALFLASAASDYVTGELIVVDGGFLLS